MSRPLTGRPTTLHDHLVGTVVREVSCCTSPRNRAISTTGPWTSSTSPSDDMSCTIRSRPGIPIRASGLRQHTETPASMRLTGRRPHRSRPRRGGQRAQARRRTVV